MLTDVECGGSGFRQRRRHEGPRHFSESGATPLRGRAGPDELLIFIFRSVGFEPATRPLRAEGYRSALLILLGFCSISIAFFVFLIRSILVQNWCGACAAVALTEVKIAARTTDRKRAFRPVSQVGPVFGSLARPIYHRLQASPLIRRDAAWRLERTLRVLGSSPSASRRQCVFSVRVLHHPRASNIRKSAARKGCEWPLAPHMRKGTLVCALPRSAQCLHDPKVFLRAARAHHAMGSRIEKGECPHRCQAQHDDTDQRRQNDDPSALAAD